MEARSNLNVVFCKVNIEQAQAISQAFRIRAVRRMIPLDAF